jgi:hypothetical protein
LHREVINDFHESDFVLGE